MILQVICPLFWNLKPQLILELYYLPWTSKHHTSGGMTGCLEIILLQGILCMIGRNILMFHARMIPYQPGTRFIECIYLWSPKTMKEIGIHQRFSLVEKVHHPKFWTISICLIVFFLCFIFIYRKRPSNRFVIHQKNMCFKIFLW